MKVITFVKGKVSPTRTKEFESEYRSIKGSSFPPGLEMSLLLRSSDDPETYTIETVWSSPEALQAMRSSGKPRAVAFFEEAGVAPTVEIHEVVETVP